jgi:hypothetical protein
MNSRCLWKIQFVGYYSNSSKHYERPKESITQLLIASRSYRCLYVRLKFQVYLITSLKLLLTPFLVSKMFHTLLCLM